MSGNKHSLLCDNVRGFCVQCVAHINLADHLKVRIALAQIFVDTVNHKFERLQGIDRFFKSFQG